MRLATLLLLLAALAAPAFAQDPIVPDTTSSWRYYPLHVGDAWEYLGYGMFMGRTRREVVADTVIEGRAYFVEARRTRAVNGSTWGAPAYRFVRFDSTAGNVIVRQGTTERVDVCGLGGAFGDTVTCATAPYPSRLHGRYGGDIRFGTLAGAFPVAARKEVHPSCGICDPTDYPVYAADLGYVGEEDADFCYQPGYCTRVLTYARVRGVVHGSPVVAAEGEARPAALALAASPNPAEGPFVLSLTVPATGAVTVEAFDVTGRQVYRATPTLAAGAHTLGVDASAWPAGVYVVRAVADGATAAVRVMRR